MRGFYLCCHTKGNPDKCTCEYKYVKLIGEPRRSKLNSPPRKVPSGQGEECQESQDKS